MKKRTFALVGAGGGAILMIVGFVVRYFLLPGTSLLDLLFVTLAWVPLKLAGVYPHEVDKVMRVALNIGAIAVPKAVCGWIAGYTLSVRAWRRNEDLAKAVWPVFWLTLAVEGVSLIGFHVG